MRLFPVLTAEDDGKVSHQQTDLFLISYSRFHRLLSRRRQHHKSHDLIDPSYRHISLSNLFDSIKQICLEVCIGIQYGSSSIRTTTLPKFTRIFSINTNSGKTDEPSSGFPQNKPMKKEAKKSYCISSLQSGYNPFYQIGYYSSRSPPIHSDLITMNPRSLTKSARKVSHG
jgi:hypothetical protein